MHHYVYRLTCTHPASPHRYYIGSRSCAGDPARDPYWGSSRPVHEAIAHYGLAHFTKKILAVYPTKEAALTKEIALHARLNVRDHPHFFNQANQTSTRFSARRRGPVSPETRAKMAAAAQRRAQTPASKAQFEAHLAGLAITRRGAPLPADQRAKIGAATARSLQAYWEGLTPEERAARARSPETRAKMSAAHRGKVHTPETKAKIAAANHGKVRSAQAKANMRAAQQARSPEHVAHLREASQAFWARLSPVGAPPSTVAIYHNMIE